jgi:PAS domain S-box-containing protein
MVFSSLGRTGSAIAIGAAGGIVAWLTGELSGLLMSVAAVCVHRSWWAGLLAVVILALFGGAILLTPLPREASAYTELAALLATSVGIWLLVWDNRRVNSHAGIERDARLIVESMPGLGWFTDAQGRILYLNPSTLEYVGVTTQDIERSRMNDATDVGWKGLVHPDDAEHSIVQWRQSVSTGQRYECEHRIRRSDGTYRWFRATAAASRDPAGRITGWYGTTIDIDEQKAAELALKESEQQLRQLIDTVPALIWCATPQGEPSYINKPLINYTGLVLDDLDTPNRTRLAGAIQSVVHPDDRPSVEARLMHSFTTGEPFSFRYRQRRADGEYRWTDGRAEPLQDESGRIVQWYGVCFDIDDEIRAQEALRRAQDKLARAMQAASLAELSASIAHEINQPLAAVVTNSHACQRWLTADPPNVYRAQVATARIIQDAHSAAERISRIRALFKRTNQVRSLININEVIAEVCDLIVDEVAEKNLVVETDLNSALPPVLVDRVQMQQVLMNLMRNGIEAMELESNARLLRIRSLRDGDMLCVEVSDLGGGVKHPEKMFEPFFTTKQSGMGMGLAICRSILEAHEGRLWAQKNVPTGTTVTFSLPIQNETSMT